MYIFIKYLRPKKSIIYFYSYSKAHDALIHFAQTIMDIVNKNNLAQRTYRDVAARTMNCEQIVPGKLDFGLQFSTSRTLV